MATGGPSQQPTMKWTFETGQVDETDYWPELPFNLAGFDVKIISDLINIIPRHFHSFPDLYEKVKAEYLHKDQSKAVKQTIMIYFNATGAYFQAASRPDGSPAPLPQDSVRFVNRLAHGQCVLVDGTPHYRAGHLVVPKAKYLSILRSVVESPTRHVAIIESVAGGLVESNFMYTCLNDDKSMLPLTTQIAYENDLVPFTAVYPTSKATLSEKAYMAKIHKEMQLNYLQGKSEIADNPLWVLGPDVSEEAKAAIKPFSDVEISFLRSMVTRLNKNKATQGDLWILSNILQHSQAEGIFDLDKKPSEEKEIPIQILPICYITGKM